MIWLKPFYNLLNINLCSSTLNAVCSKLLVVHTLRVHTAHSTLQIAHFHVLKCSVQSSLNILHSRLYGFPDILSQDKVSQDTFCPGTICLAKICCSWLLMGVDGETFCPGYVFTGKTYCPGTKCLTEVLLLALPFWVL